MYHLCAFLFDSTHSRQEEEIPLGLGRDICLLIHVLLVKLEEKFGILQVNRLILKVTQIAPLLNQRKTSEQTFEYR